MNGDTYSSRDSGRQRTDHVSQGPGIHYFILTIDSGHGTTEKKAAIAIEIAGTQENVEDHDLHISDHRGVNTKKIHTPPVATIVNENAKTDMVAATGETRYATGTAIGVVAETVDEEMIENAHLEEIATCLMTAVVEEVAELELPEEVVIEAAEKTETNLQRKTVVLERALRRSQENLPQT